MAEVTWLAGSDGKRLEHHSRRSRPYNSVVRRLRTVGPQRSSIAPRAKAISKAPFTLTFARQPKALGFTLEEDQSPTRGSSSPIELAHRDLQINRRVDLSSSLGLRWSGVEESDGSQTHGLARATDLMLE